jgi:hypothetical protein
LVTEMMARLLSPQDRVSPACFSTPRSTSLRRDP